MDLENTDGMKCVRMYVCIAVFLLLLIEKLSITYESAMEVRYLLF